MAPQRIGVGCTGLGLLFHLVGVDHHGNRLVGVEGFLTVSDSQSLERLLGLVDAALANKPPGRLGGEPDSDYQGNRPHPLQGKGNLVSPLVVACNHASEHARGNELTKDPAEVDVGGEVGSEMSRADLRGIGGGQSLEDTPRDADQDLADQELDQSLGEEDDEDEADAAAKCANERLAIAESICDDAVDEETQDLAAQSPVGETRLPRSSELVAAVGLQLAKLLLERRVGEEVVEEDNVEALHDDTQGEEDGPQAGFLVQLEGLEQAHVVLLLGGRGGFTSNGSVHVEMADRDTACPGVVGVCCESHDDDPDQLRAMKKSGKEGVFAMLSSQKQLRAVRCLESEAGDVRLADRDSILGFHARALYSCSRR